MTFVQVWDGRGHDPADQWIIVANKEVLNLHYALVILGVHSGLENMANLDAEPTHEELIQRWRLAANAGTQWLAEQGTRNPIGASYREIDDRVKLVNRLVLEHGDGYPVGDLA